MRFHRILVPTDFSPCAREALEVALGLASAVGGSVTLVNVFASAPSPAGEAASRRSLDALGDSVRAGAPGVAIWVQPLSGDVAEEILRAAASGGFDLVVLGSHGRSGFRRAVLGSVADAVARRSPLPVLTIREAADERHSYRAG